MSKEFKVGLLAVIAGVILYLGFNFLKGIDFFSPTARYYAVYDNVDGLIVSNPVIVNGYSVGRVSRISIMQDKGNKILVELDVNENLILGDSTTATLANNDLLGSKAIILDIKEIRNRIEVGDTVIAQVDKGLSELLASAEPITNNLSITITRINDILLGLQGSGEVMNDALSNLNKTLEGVTRMIEQNERGIEQAISEFGGLMAETKAKVEQLDPILSKSEQTLDKLNAIEIEKTLQEVNTLLGTMNSTLVSIQEGEGTLGQMMTNDSLYNNLNQAMIDLDKLLVHFNENPKHFLAPLGKSAKRIEKDKKKE